MNEMGMEDILGHLAPDERQKVLSQLVGLGGLQDKNAMLQEQMAQAQALLNAPRQRYNTWAGALAGGLGDIVSNIGNKQNLDRLSAEQAKLMPQIEAGRRTYADLLSRRPQPPPTPVYDNSAPMVAPMMFR